MTIPQLQTTFLHAHDNLRQSQLAIVSATQCGANTLSTVIGNEQHLVKKNQHSYKHFSKRSEPTSQHELLQPEIHSKPSLG